MKGTVNVTVHRATNHMLQQVRQHCEHCHYLHRWPDARSLPFSYYLQCGDEPFAPDGRLWGLVVLKKPQHHQQRHLFGYGDLPTAWQVLDLARVWVHPALQRRSRMRQFGTWLANARHNLTYRQISAPTSA